MIDRQKRLVWIAPALLLVWGCSTTDLLGGFNLISETEEMQLGDELSQELAKQSVIVEDPAIVAPIQSLGAKLVSATSNPTRPYHFYVVKEAEVNAFAIPGWRLYVHTGLIEAAKNEAEVAAVLAHEIGHAEKRHATQNLSRRMGTQMLLDIALGRQQNSASQIANMIVNTSLLSYSRSAENEADAFAIQVLDRAGYDPKALPNFFQTLLEIEPATTSRITSLFSSHPETRERIRLTQESIAQLPAKSYTTGDAAAFKQLQEATKKLK